MCSRVIWLGQFRGHDFQTGGSEDKRRFWKNRAEISAFWQKSKKKRIPGRSRYIYYIYNYLSIQWSNGLIIIYHDPCLHFSPEFLIAGRQAATQELRGIHIQDLPMIFGEAVLKRFVQ